MNKTIAIAILGFGLASSAAFAVPPPPGWNQPKPAAAIAVPAALEGGVSQGSVNFVLGERVMKLDVASGTIKKQDGIYMVDLTYKDLPETSINVGEPKGKLFRLAFGAAKTGKASIITMLVAKDEKVTSMYRSAQGKCKVMITRLEEKAVEGTADCPSGMIGFDDKPAPAVTAIAFRAQI